MQLEGKRIVVTGGAQGIGAAAVRAFVAEGARTVSMDVKVEEGREVAVLASGDGPGRAVFVECDISNRASVETAFAAAATELGGLDALVHVAGVVSRHTPAEDITDAEWDRMNAINGRGTMLTNQAAFRLMKDGGGRIVNFSSGAALNGLAGAADYSAAKSAVLGWTRAIAREWAQYGITANAISPVIETTLIDQFMSGKTDEERLAYRAVVGNRVPMGGKGDADRDMAPVLVFLAGEGSRFITGQTIPVDGGRSMAR